MRHLSIILLGVLAALYASPTAFPDEAPASTASDISAAAPASPVSPAAPASPVSPVSPVSPAAPAAPVSPAAPALLDAAVATVNSQPITISQVQARLKQLRERAAAAGVANPSAEQAVGVEINRVLIAQAAERGLEKGMLDRVRELARERAAKQAGPRRYELKRTVTDDSVYRDLLIQAYLQIKVDSRVFVSPADVKTYYDGHVSEYSSAAAVITRQLLIRAEKHENGEAEAIAEKAYERIMAGEEFAAVARELSEGPYASEGGLWPATPRGDLIPDVESVAFGMKAGEVSKPFQTNLGWCVVKVESTSGGATIPYEEAQLEITQSLLAARRREAENRLLADLRSKAIIKILNK